ncbi:unnamed protein product [Heterobilharzia americana]|nr:unnamed protein product [Heterobilharzia americana]
MFSKKCFKLIFDSILYRTSWRCISIGVVTTCYSISPIKLYHISSEEPIKTPIYRSIDYPLLFSLQLQLDCTISFINQLLKEFQRLLCNMENIIVQYNKIKLSYHLDSDKHIDELMLKLQSQWSILTQQLDIIEMTIKSAIRTLHNSLETGLLYEEYINKSQDASNCLNEILTTTTSQTSTNLYNIEKEFTSLEDKRKEMFKIWINQLAENIKQFGK